MPLAIRQHSETATDNCRPCPAAGPLPGDADRAIPLLGKAALVDDQRAGRLAAQQIVGVAADLRCHGLVVPRRLADEMLELLSAPILDHGGHRFKCTVYGLRKSAQILVGDGRVVASTGAKEMAARSRKLAKSEPIASTKDTVSCHPRIRLFYELPDTLRLRFVRL